MKVYSSTIRQDDLAAIADAMGIEVYNYDPAQSFTPRVRGKFKGKVCHSFVLRPKYGEDAWRKSGFNGRRTWAVSWAGHYVFMRAVFAMDEDAIITSGAEKGYATGSERRNRAHWGMEYRGVGDFIERAPQTGEANKGSEYAPEQYVKQEVENHFQWDSDIDVLEAEAGRIARSVTVVR